MTIVLPIILGAVLMGLYSPRMNARAWWFLGFWIFLIVMYNLMKKT